MHILNKNSISVIGGAGHVGFPLGLAFALKRYSIRLIDINKTNIEKIKNGEIPFKEKNARVNLKKCLREKRIKFANNLSQISQSKYIIVCIGTPINNDLKPNIKYFLNFFYDLRKNIKKEQIIVIRS